MKTHFAFAKCKSALRIQTPLARRSYFEFCFFARKPFWGGMRTHAWNFFLWIFFGWAFFPRKERSMDSVGFEPTASCFFVFLFWWNFFPQKKFLAKQARCHCATSPLAARGWWLLWQEKEEKQKILQNAFSFAELDLKDRFYPPFYFAQISSRNKWRWSNRRFPFPSRNHFFHQK